MFTGRTGFITKLNFSDLESLILEKFFAARQMTKPNILSALKCRTSLPLHLLGRFHAFPIFFSFLMASRNDHVEIFLHISNLFTEEENFPRRSNKVRVHHFLYETAKVPENCFSFYR